MKKIYANKIISYIVTFMLSITLIPNNYAMAEPLTNEENDNEIQQSIDTVELENDEEVLSLDGIKPNITLNYQGVTPSEPVVGQEFTVTYEIVPEPFQYNISQPKEIVLVLDGSGSMGEKINGGKTRLEELKSAAKAFIEKMKSVENLKIGIVVYSSSATINPISVNGTTTVKRYYNNRWDNRTVPNYKSYTKEYFLDINDSNLITMINNITAMGGTNIGEGLRKAKFLLDEGDSNANKSIILMSDGLATYYSIEGSNLKGYMEINNSNPSISGAGNETSSSTIENSTAYAMRIGSEKISGNGYNIFSIGYGLGSTGNIKMQAIHRSMGGVVNSINPDDYNNTFFATSEGAIESVFSKIADVLINSYSISDVNLNLNLSNSITSFNGGEVNVNGHKVSIDPIVYERKENNWYRAEKQIVEIKMKSNESGSIKLFKEGSKITYTDINGNLQEVPIENITINVRPYDPELADKLDVDFATTKKGYLIGDTVDVKVTFTHSGRSEIEYSNVKFTLNKNTIPSNFITEDGFNNVLNFGTLKETTSKSYKFNIGGNEEIGYEAPTVYTLTGSYTYKINGTVQSNTQVSANVNVKRGQIKIKVNDSLNNDITSEATVVLNDSSNNEILGKYSEGYIVFDEVPSGNHEVIIKEVPSGCYISDENKNKIIAVSYENPVAMATFNVDGAIPVKEADIKAMLKEYTTEVSSENDEIIVTYNIQPQSFELPYMSISNGQVKKSEEVVFVMDTSSAMQGNARETFIVNGYSNQIKNKGYKFSFVGFNESVTFPTSSYDKFFSTNGTDEEKNLLNGVFFQDGLKAQSVDSRNVGSALIKADELLTNKGEEDKSKAIVLIAAGELNYTTEQIKNIKNKGYKIVTVDLSSPDKVGKNNIKELHCELNGVSEATEENGYFVATAMDIRYDEQGNAIQYNFNRADDDMKKVAQYLESTVNIQATVSSIIKDVKLYFDLNGNFEAIDDTLIQDANNENKYYFNIQDIVYTPDSNKNENGLYTYVASSFDVSFKIKVKKNKFGTLTFAENDELNINNYLQYKNFDKTLSDKKAIETPRVNIIGTIVSDLEHGLYEGKNNDGSAIITENDNGFEFSNGAVVNFGATFKASGSNITTELVMAPELVDYNNKTDVNINGIKVYKSTVTNNITTYDEIDSDKLIITRTNWTYKIHINESIASNTEILIIYTGVIPKNTIKDEYFNIISVSSLSKKTKVYVNGVKLPDLY